LIYSSNSNCKAARQSTEASEVAYLDPKRPVESTAWQNGDCLMCRGRTRRDSHINQSASVAHRSSTFRWFSGFVFVVDRTFPNIVNIASSRDSNRLYHKCNRGIAAGVPW